VALGIVPEKVIDLLEKHCFERFAVVLARHRVAPDSEGLEKFDSSDSEGLEKFDFSDSEGLEKFDSSDSDRVRFGHLKRGSSQTGPHSSPCWSPWWFT